MDTTSSSSLGFEVIRIAGVLGPLLIMLLGLVLVFWRLKTSGDSLDEHYIRLTAIVLFVPMLPFISIILPNFPSEALIALLGTVGGYLLSRGDTSKDGKKN